MKHYKTGKSSHCSLYCACASGRRKEALLMLEDGADIEEMDFQGYSALHGACYEGHRNLTL